MITVAINSIRIPIDSMVVYAEVCFYNLASGSCNTLAHTETNLHNHLQIIELSRGNVVHCALSNVI